MKISDRRQDERVRDPVTESGRTRGAAVWFGVACAFGVCLGVRVEAPDELSTTWYVQDFLLRCSLY